MDLTGYFGKVPAARDFVFHGLPVRATEAWAAMAAGWMATLRNVGQDDYQRHVLSSPVWRFLLPAGFGGEAGIRTAAGLMAGSMDGAGRVFPFAVLLVSSEALVATRPNAALDGALDRIEPAMLGFMEDQATKDQLVQALATAADDLSQALRRPTTTSPFLTVSEGAACFSGVRPSWSGEGATKAMSLPSAKSPERAESYWWHDGHGDRRPQFYAVRGLPSEMTARPLFIDDWPTGWQPRQITGEGLA